MKRLVMMLVLVAAGAARGQDRDLEVTMEVVPPGSSASGAIGEIRLPDNVGPRAGDAASGRGQADRAQQLTEDLGKDAGREVSEAVRERGRREAARERARERFEAPKAQKKGK